MSEISKLSNRLFGGAEPLIRNIKISPGSHADVTREEYAVAINKVLDQIESGHLTFVDNVEN